MINFLRDALPIMAPLVSISLAVLGFMHKRSPATTLRNRCTELADLIEKVPEDERHPLIQELSGYIADLKSEFHYLRVRKLSGATAATVVVVALVGGLAIAGAIWLSAWWAWTVGILIATFCLLLELVGVGQLYEVPADDRISPPRVHRERKTSQK